MGINSQEYAPYFREGLLYLPEKTVHLLVACGLDEQKACAALHGLALDDDRILISEISTALENVMAQVVEHSPVYQQLNNQNAFFLLTGKPAL